mgnify:CR=1 FL=1
MNLAAASFTFHYVSILIALYQLTPKCGTDFTFHYVAILIEKISMCQCAGPIYIPLYFYFNDRVHLRYISTSFIYIPSCFYFNLDTREF